MANVILLNGSSSAGKSTLAEALQQRSIEPYQHLALDQFRDGLPMRYRGLNSPAGTPGHAGLNIIPERHPTSPQGVTKIEFGDHGRTVLQAMRRSIAAFVDLGLNVVVDDLLLEPEFVEDYARVLDPQRVWVVGVRCDLETVNAREANRVGRFPGTALAHFEQVHAHIDQYDIEVDTGNTTAIEAADYIIAQMQYPPQTLMRGLARRP